MGSRRARRCLRPIVAFAFVLAWTLGVRDARAEDSETVQKGYDDTVSALDAHDCNTACLALGSLRRSADRICALDGETSATCTHARERAEDARRRVLEACPQCAEAAAAPPIARPTAPAPAPVAESAPVSTQAAPRHGGCASCDEAGAPSPADAGWILLVACALLCRGRRTRSTP